MSDSKRGESGIGKRAIVKHDLVLIGYGDAAAYLSFFFWRSCSALRSLKSSCLVLCGNGARG